MVKHCYRDEHHQKPLNYLSGGVCEHAPTFLCHPFCGDDQLIMAIPGDECPYWLPPDNVQHSVPLLQSIGYYHGCVAFHCLQC